MSIWVLMFWGSLTVVAYTYAGYPAVLSMLGLLRRWGSRRPWEGPLPSACLVISAFNEETIIGEKIENTLTFAMLVS